MSLCSDPKDEAVKGSLPALLPGVATNPKQSIGGCLGGNEFPSGQSSNLGRGFKEIQCLFLEE